MTTPIDTYMHTIGQAARHASRAMAKADTASKNRALGLIAAAIRRDAALLSAANQRALGDKFATGVRATVKGSLLVAMAQVAPLRSS